MKYLLLLLGTTLLVSALAERRRYEGYQVWETKPSKDQYQQLWKWEEKGLIDTMGNEVLVAPAAVPLIRTIFQENNIEFTVQNENIQIYLDEMWKDIDSRRAYDPNAYNTYGDIISEIDRMADEDCPSGFDCSTYSIGTSLNGRDIRMFSITQGSGRPILWFDSLIHAREWLAGATMMRIMDEFLNSYGSDDDATHVLDNYDIYYLPVHNPDGYAYTFSNDRMWRKNRRPNSGSSCVGVDLNRNYDWRWSAPGASSNPCSETFYGPSVASELETQAVQNEASSLASRIVHFATVHTVVPAWLLSYGDCTDPPNAADAMRVANAAVDAIEATHNTNWGVGNSCRVLYQTSGTTADWARAQGIPYTATPELRGPGFTPPPSAIQPSFEEMWNGFIAMVYEIEAIGMKKTVA